MWCLSKANNKNPLEPLNSLNWMNEWQSEWKLSYCPSDWTYFIKMSEVGFFLSLRKIFIFENPKKKSLKFPLLLPPEVSLYY